MKCPKCTDDMVTAKATNFGEEYYYCRGCKKELSEIKAEVEARLLVATHIYKQMAVFPNGGYIPVPIQYAAPPATNTPAISFPTPPAPGSAPKLLFAEAKNKLLDAGRAFQCANGRVPSMFYVGSNIWNALLTGIPNVPGKAVTVAGVEVSLDTSLPPEYVETY